MIVKNEVQYREVLAQALEDGLIAMDTETEEFTKEKSHSFQLELDGVGIYSENVKAYIPVKFLDKEFQMIFDHCEIIFHNAKFDLTIMEKEGYKVEKAKIYDTMIMAWLLNENRFSFGLKQLAVSVLKVKKEKVVEFRTVKKRPILEEYGMFPQMYEDDLKVWLKELGEYCIDDCKYTYKLYNKFKPQLEEQDLWKIYVELEIPFIEVLRKMENRGISVDVDYLKKFKHEMELEIIEIQKDIYKLAGGDFDIKSAKQLAVKLYDKETGLGYDLPNEYLTKTKKLSTNVAALKYLLEEHDCPLVKRVLDFRELYKLYSTYVVGLLAKLVDGVMHASFHQHGTVTGRLSSSNPNLQNLPRRDDKWNIREAFVARPGYTFVISDLSQIELRIAAHFSGDETLVNAYKEGKDVHQETADLLGVERHIAKTVNFGLLYGRTAYGMSHALDMTPDEAEKFIAKYFAKFKKLHVFMEQAKNTIKTKYAIRTLLKRKRRFPDYAKARKERDWILVRKMERQAANAVIQGTAADIMKVQMRNMVRKLKGMDAHLIVQIHDEVIVECPEGKAEEVMKIVKYEMENAIVLPDIPIITEPKISKRWTK